MGTQSSGSPAASAAKAPVERAEPSEAPHPEFQDEVAPPPLGFAALIVVAGLALPIATVVAITILVAKLFW